MVTGASRFLNKIYANDISIDSGTFGTITTSGSVNIGTTQANAILNLNGKRAFAGTDNWLRINDKNNTQDTIFSSGVCFGTSVVRTDGSFKIGNAGANIDMTTTYAAFKVPIYINATSNPSYYWDTSGNIKANDVNSSTGQINNLFVPNELRALSYSIETINSLGGAFYVAPTINVPAGNNVNITAISGTTITASISGSFSLTTFPQAIWAANSKVKVTGKIGGIPIGTCDGYLRAALTTSSIQVTFTYDGTKALTVANNQASEDVSVMIYSVGADKPIGIYMTAWGDTAWSDETAHNKSSISIYGGTTSSDTAPTTSTPVVRIGNLTGLPNISSGQITVQPQGWGIYTTHGFFSGSVVTNEGLIGGFTLYNNKLYTTNNTLGQGANNVYLSTDGISLGTTFKVTNAGELTATSGTIGGWTIGTSDIHSGTHSSSTASGNGLYIGTSQIAGGSGGTWYLKNDGTGKIGKWTFASNGSLSTGSGTTQAGMGDGTYAFWAGNSTTSSAPFRVTYAGALTATSGKIGKYTITDTYLYTGSGSTQAGIGGNQAFWAGSTDSNSAPFRVGYDGSAVFTNATIGNPSSYHVAVSSSDVGIFSDATTKIASYGASTTIGKTDSKNIYIDSQGLNIRTGSTVLAKYGKDTIIGSDHGQCIKLNNGGFAFYDYVEDTNLFSIGGDNVGTPRTKSGTYSTTTLTVSLDGFPKTGTAIKVGSTNAFTTGTSGTYTASSVTYTYDGGNVIKISRATAASNASYQFSYTADYIAEPVVTIGKTTSDHFVIESGKISANNEYNNPVFSVDINGGENRQDVLLAREDATNKTTTISLADAYANSTSGQNKVIRVVVSLDVSLKSGYHFSSSSGANEVYQNSSGIYRLKWQEYRYGYVELNSSGSSVLNSDIWQTTFPSVLNSSNTAVSITNTLADNLENITSTSQTNYTITTSLSGTNIIDSVTYTVEVYYAVITTAPSYNCGLRSGTAGAFSSILGNNLYATDDAQVAIGKNNIASKSAFIIGNGSDAYHRSNALTVDWSGNLNIAGNITADGFRSIGLLPTSGSPTTASIDTNPAGVIQEIWSSLPYDVATADVRPFAGLVYATGGVCSIFGFRYGSNGEYGAVHYNHYNGNCGDVTVNNNVFTAHNTGKPTTFTFTRNTTNTTELVASRCTIVDHTVCVMARLKVNASTGEKTVGTIPSAYAPPVTVFGSVAIMSGNNSVYPQYCYINSSGGVVLSSTNNLTPNVTLMFTYQI